MQARESPAAAAGELQRELRSVTEAVLDRLYPAINPLSLRRDRS
jgi:hypothetical protein